MQLIKWKCFFGKIFKKPKVIGQLQFACSVQILALIEVEILFLILLLGEEKKITSQYFIFNGVQ
jgi:hypothetical protein